MQKSLSQNTTFIPHNQQDENYKTVHEVFLQAWIDSLQKLELDTIQKGTLELVACQDPMMGGEAVFSARVMLTNWQGCGSQKMANGTKSNDLLNEINIYNPEDFENANPLNSDEKIVINKLYPNPNNGTMWLDYHLIEGLTGELLFYDITGKELFRYTLNNDKNGIALSKGALKNGIYFYEFRINGVSYVIEKLVIIK